MPATGGRWPLVGRDEELALLDAEARRGPVVVAGPAGVGKSRLVADWCRDLDGTTTTVTATRSSRTVPFGAVAPWVPPDLSAGAAPSATLRAVARHLATAARTVVVDDAHLLDDGSAAAILDLARHHDVRLVVTVRSGGPCPDPVTALWADGIGTRLDLRPLAEPECAHLLERRLGGRADAVAHRRLWSLSGGNPMHLCEAAEAALDQGRLVEADGEWTWTGPLTGTPRLVDLVEARIGRTTVEERRVLEVVALGEPIPLDVVLDVVAAEPVTALEAAGLLSVVDRAGTEVVGLGHPLYGEVLRATTGRLRAREHRRALAGAGLRHGLERTDPLRIALWLGDGSAGPAGTELLVGASHRAMVLQDYDLSLRLADGAVEGGGGAPALVARSRTLSLQGRHAEAAAALDEAAALATGPGEVVDVAQLRAIASLWALRSSEGAVAVVHDARARLSAGEAAQVTATAACTAVVALDLDRGRAWATAARAPLDPGTTAWALAMASDALAAAWQGDPGVLIDVQPALTRAAGRALATDVVPSALAAVAFQHAMVLAGRAGEAAERLGRALDRDPTEASVYVALPALLVARTALAEGRVGTAATRARQALDLMGRGGYVFGRPVVAAATLATAAAQAGDPAMAEEALDRAESRHDRWVPDARAHLDLARAWATAALGHLSEAVAGATDVAVRLATAGAHGLAVPALLDVVRMGGAADVTTRLEGRRHDHPFAAATADLAQALADADGAALDAASARWESLGGRLVAAEAAAQAARAHDRAGLRQREAAARRRAHDLLAGCEGARTPLLAGLDSTDVDTLTAREREVVLMAAAGATNRGIATELGLSLRTVNSHLNHAYAKLGTSDRHELADLLDPVSERRPR